MRGLFILGAIAAAAAPASAAEPVCPATPPMCASLPNPIYIQAGDTQQNLLKRLGRALRDNTGHEMTLVFFLSGSCSNTDNFYHHSAPWGSTTKTLYIPSMAEDPGWLPSNAECPCTATAGTLPDIGNSATFVSSCTTEAPPATVTLINGPTQAYVMAVPKASSQTALTYEEAYFVFGFGMLGMVQPWIDETEMFIRTITKSTLLTWAANIGVPANKWKGTMFAASSDVVSHLQNASNPEAAIGILGAEVYDADRSFLTELAFRAKDQYAAYFADSTSTSFDKQNVRDGHYTVWAPTVWMYNTDGAGNAVSADAKFVIDLISGHAVANPPNFDPTTIVARVGLVPDCAMRVQRDFDGGPLRLYKPSISCTCKYLSDVDISPCDTCDAQTPCSIGVCRAGYCEEF
ncbi:MAG: hypothetical protein ACM31C_01665 [Acidobacteriota bacterium]